VFGIRKQNEWSISLAKPNCRFALHHNPDFTRKRTAVSSANAITRTVTAITTHFEVNVKGEVDPRSGFVVDLKQLKEILHREVLTPWTTVF
jgi:hypothetical protein